jgi:hypothetical protein
MEKCIAITKKGKRCSFSAFYGAYCKLHSYMDTTNDEEKEIYDSIFQDQISFMGTIEGISFRVTNGTVRMVDNSIYDDDNLNYMRTSYSLSHPNRLFEGWDPNIGKKYVSEKFSQLLSEPIVRHPIDTNIQAFTGTGCSIHENYFENILRRYRGHGIPDYILSHVACKLYRNIMEPVLRFYKRKFIQWMEWQKWEKENKSSNVLGEYFCDDLTNSILKF